MIEITTREFTRNFSRYRAKAATGERIRIASPDGNFVFQKEPEGLTARELKERAEKKGGVFDFEPERITRRADTDTPATSPWD